MGALINIPTAATPAARLLSRFNRDQIAGFIEVAIGLLDLANGDPDFELGGDEEPWNGDEADYAAAERIDQCAPIVGTGNDQFNPGNPEDAEEDDDDGCSTATTI